jgi:hypothetical protein
MLFGSVKKTTATQLEMCFVNLDFFQVGAAEHYELCDN